MESLKIGEDVRGFADEFLLELRIGEGDGRDLQDVGEGDEGGGDADAPAAGQEVCGGEDGVGPEIEARGLDGAVGDDESQPRGVLIDADGAQHEALPDGAAWEAEAGPADAAGLVDLVDRLGAEQRVPAA